MEKQNNTLTIVKAGGKLIEDPEQLEFFLSEFVKIKGKKILVHGGGKAATAWSEKLGLTPTMIEGRRVTDAATLEVVTMVYAGLYNKTIVSHLQKKNCNALGLTGADLNVIQAHKRIVKDINYGFAGDIDAVNVAALQLLLDQGITPVFCAITHDKKGQLLNTNADTIASQLAAGLAEVYETTLKFCFEKNGILIDPQNDDSVIDNIDLATYQNHKASGVISAGMIPKMENAFFALQNKTSKVFICGVHGIPQDAQQQGTKIELQQ